MLNREQVIEMILKLSKDEKEIDIVELAKIDGVVDFKDVGQKAFQQQALQRVRSLVHRVHAKEGLKVRSVSKNKYKVINEEDPSERKYQFDKRVSKLQKSWEDFKNYQAYMVSKGDPVQVEMLDSSLAAFVGAEVMQYDVQNEKSNQTIAVTRASAKSKKASGH